MKAILQATLASLCLLHGASFAADTMPDKTMPDKTMPSKSSQQSKMKTCNAEAKTKALKGAERKTFMSECLKAK